MSHTALVLLPASTVGHDRDHGRIARLRDRLLHRRVLQRDTVGQRDLLTPRLTESEPLVERPARKRRPKRAAPATPGPVQADRTNTPRTRAGPVCGSSARTSPSWSDDPVYSLSRRLQPPHAT